MSGNLLNRIEENRQFFSKNQNVIAEYILNNYNKSTFLTAQNLASELGISESTVVRFATMLGYEGYKELRDDIHELAKINLTNLDRINLYDVKNKYDLLDYSLNSDYHDIKKLIANINRDHIFKAVDILDKAENIYVMGLRSSSFLAKYFCLYLKLIGKKVINIDLCDDIYFENMINMTENDVFFCISYPRYSKKLIDVVKYVKNKKTEIISLTDNDRTVIARNSDLVLIAQNDIIMFIDSFIAPLSIINAIIVLLGYKSIKHTEESLYDMEAVFKKYNIYDFDPYNE